MRKQGGRCAIGGNVGDCRSGGQGRHAKRDVNCSCESCIRRKAGADVTKWELSEAKQYLKEALLDDVHHYWKDAPGVVYDDNCSLFHLYKYENFRNYLNTLKKKTSSEQDIIKFDENTTLHESVAFPRGELTNQGTPYYDTSDTKNVLARMAKDGTLHQCKHCPSTLRNSDLSLQQEFPPRVFAKHVNK